MQDFDSAIARKEREFKADKEMRASLLERVKSCNSLISIFEGKLRGEFQDTSIGLKTFTPDDDYGMCVTEGSITLCTDTVTSLLRDLRVHKDVLMTEIYKIESKYEVQRA